MTRKIRARTLGFCTFMAIICLTIAGCPLQSNIRVGEFDCSSLSKSGIFDRLPQEARVDEFAHYDVAKQYAVLICSDQYIHLPTGGFLEPFALEGEKVIGFLKARLIDAQGDQTIEDIVSVLLLMVIYESYDVAGDKELMRRVQQRVNAMKDPYWKKLTVIGVDTICEMSNRIGLLAVESGMELCDRREVFFVLRSEGFSNRLDYCVNLRPVGEIAGGFARQKLFIHERQQVKLLLVFSQAHYLGSYPLDQLPTGIKGNRLEFPGTEEQGNSIVFDSDLPPQKIYLGRQVRELSK